MILSRPQLTTLLNALYETGTERVAVEHPCEAVGELLEFELGPPFESPVRFTQRLPEYASTRENIERTYGRTAHDDLPDENAYVRCLVAGGVLNVANRDAIDEFIDRHGHPDLEAGHAPAVVGIDANIMPFRIAEVLDIDPRTGTRDDRDRRPTNGYALATGVKAELDWHYKQHHVESLVDAFGEAFERLDDEPAGDSREGFLGLYEHRRLLAERNVDIVKCEEGDEAIVEAYREFHETSRKDVLLFSNDFGFVQRAKGADVPAQHVDFRRQLPRKTTASWDGLSDTLYYLAVRFGVIVLPGVTLYGVWNGKDGRHWQQHQLAVECRSPKIEPLLQRDRQIVEAFENG